MLDKDQLDNWRTGIGPANAIFSDEEIMRMVQNLQRYVDEVNAVSCEYVAKERRRQELADKRIAGISANVLARLNGAERSE